MVQVREWLIRLRAVRDQVWAASSSRPKTNRGRMAPLDSQSILRPAMRRKSSAQNLLSSFKPGGSGTSNNNSNHAPPVTSVVATGSSSSSNGNNNMGINGTHIPTLLPPHVLSAPLLPTPAPPPSSYIPPPTTSSTSSSIFPIPNTSGASTPSIPHFSAMHHAQQQQSSSAAAAAFVALGGPASAAAVAATMREWDAQSMADSPSLFPLPVSGGAPGGSSPGATVEYLRDLVQKRIITLTYMRNVHDGCGLLPSLPVYVFLTMMLACSGGCRRSHWFHTIAMSRTELDRVFNNAAMKKRCVVHIPGIPEHADLPPSLGHIDSRSSPCRSHPSLTSSIRPTFCVRR